MVQATVQDSGSVTPAECRGWQPIETVPKDGSVILIVDMTDRYPNVQAASWWPERDNKFPWTLFEGNNGRDGLNALDARFPPTHWMPLPKPPQNDDRTVIPTVA